MFSAGLAEPRSVKIQAYGSEAARYAAALPPDVPAVLADAGSPDQAALALAMAVEVRKSGTTFFTAALVDEPRAVVARMVAPAILAQVPDVDQRQRLFDQLAVNQLTINNQPQSAIGAHDGRVLETLRDLLLVGDAMLCRSWRERDRVVRLLGRPRPFVGIAPGEDRMVPDIAPAGVRDTIVIYAPAQPAAASALLAFALEELRFPVIVLCADGAPLPLRAASAGPGETAAVLRRALLVVDGSLSDPAGAIAFAQRGFPVVCASTSGADEYLDGLIAFDPWDRRSIYRAAISAIGNPAPRLRERPDAARALAATLQAAAPPRLDDEPLVSIVMPTYNRRALLPTALRSLGAQCYRNLEVVVVNDGGEPVDDVVTPFPFARVVEAGRAGVIGAMNAGIAAARGTYVGFLADDDIDYPDHVARLVHALERTGALAAHGNDVIRFLEPAGPDLYRTFGIKSVLDGCVDPAEMMYASRIAGQSYIARREFFERRGGFDAQYASQHDYEMELRISREGDFVHVDFATNEFLYRADPTQINAREAGNLGDDARKVYAAYPAPDRPTILQAREAHVAAVERHRNGEPFWVPAIRLSADQQAAIPAFSLNPSA